MITHGLILACFFLIFTVSSGQDFCTSSACSAREPKIQFPFRLQDNQPNWCGYPGFALTCDSSRATILTLKNLKFRVREIDYLTQHIYLNDPNECLPRLLLTLNLSGTPFEGASQDSKQFFTLFNCSSSNATIHSYNYDLIYCLSDPSYDVVAAVGTMAAAQLTAASCTVMKAVFVPGLRLFHMSADMMLRWDEPQCWECESGKGICGLSRNSDDVECTYPQGGTRNTRNIVVLSIGISAILSTVVIVSFVIKKIKSTDRGRTGGLNQGGIEVASSVAPQPTCIISGLDEAVIESFPKSVAGESRREDNVCAICLGEYSPKDSITTVPVCRHCFHSTCIDEWLRLNATCPVCRKYQKHSSLLSEDSGSAPAS